MVVRSLGALAVAAFVIVGSGRFQPASAAGELNQTILTCSVSNTTPTTGSKIDVACTLDNMGAPLVNTELAFYINFENRADVSFPNGRTTQINRTDDQGKIKTTIDTGPKAGNFGLLVNFPGIYSSYTYVTVTAPAPPPVPLELAPAPLPPATDVGDLIYVTLP